MMQRAPLDGRVLGAFQRACLLQMARDEVVALVFPEIGDGPLNIVVDKQQGVFAPMEPSTPVRLDEDRLYVGELETMLDQATVWEPRPDWEQLRRCHATILEHVPRLRALAVQCAPPESLWEVLVGPAADLAYAVPAKQAAEDLRAAWGSGREADGRVKASAERLAGLGCGLTPAGDDFLAGAMLWAWLAQRNPEPFCQVVLEAAAPRTTTLSVAFLRATAKGECTAAWHPLLSSLMNSAGRGLEVAVQEVISHGHTSGADMLAGFVWMGLAPVEAGIAQVMGDS